jgi:predicted transcriptional regulator
MTGRELRIAIADLDLSPYEFARFARADPSTVYKWVRPDATVPGYVVTIVELLRQIRDLHHHG